jgi:hypothetical protein
MPTTRPARPVADDTRLTFAPTVCFRLPGGEPQTRRESFELCGGWPCSEIDQIARELTLEAHPAAEILWVD